MKMSIFFIAFIYVNVAVGQLTYTAEQHITLGDQIVYSVTNVVNPSLDFKLSGEDITWTYEDLIGTRQDTQRYFDPNDAGYKSSFCLANFYLFNCDSKFSELTNLALVSADSIVLEDFRAENFVRHFHKDVERFSETLLGISVELNGVVLPAGIALDSEDVILRFPFTYGSVDSSESRLDIDLSPLGVEARFIRDRKRLNVVEGYGDLKTPSGHYNEVLKMKTLIYNIDTVRYDTLQLITTITEIEYKWFAKGFAGPVLVARGLIVEGEELIAEMRYQQEAEVSSLPQYNLKSGMILYPNPFSNFIQIKGMREPISRIELYNLNGHLVKSQENVSDQIDVNVDLRSGVYIVKIDLENGHQVTYQMLKI